ncbi:hypothetical protein [Massilia sp. S19_KUP03_FR1]|uniref:hypothetical protein n=1 Tax=Massilia sp. S19_KUP03_FR1 TaxID=3025503 RepID=UPI002FCD47BF
MTLYLRKAIVLGLGALLSQAALAQTTDNAAVLKEKAIRQDVQEKQKALAQSLRNDTPAPVAAPSAPLELIIDETDSPGATK